MNFDFIIVVVALPEYVIKILKSGLIWHQKSCKNGEMYQFYSSGINFVAIMTENIIKIMQINPLKIHH